MDELLTISKCSSGKYVPPGQSLCHDGDAIRWSGFVPYY
jgi:hypothetical protein